MNVLNPTELEFAAALATLTPANPTPEQRELAQQLLLAFNQKAMALDALATRYLEQTTALVKLQGAVADAVNASLQQSLDRVRAFGQVARNAEAKRVFDAAKAGQQP